MSQVLLGRYAPLLLVAALAMNACDGGEVTPTADAGTTDIVKAVCSLDKDCPAATDPCQIGRCEAGQCKMGAMTAGTKCDDDNACTTDETCLGGHCGTTNLDLCDDGNLCTSDTCDPKTGCSHGKDVVSVCEEGDPCTVGDQCADGTCKPGPATNCDDGKLCTDDSCESDSGCVYKPHAGACDDGDACTNGDACQGGACASGVPANCNDQNVCTNDTCDKSKGCAHSPTEAACDDGDVCTVGDACQASACLPGGATACDDSNPCTNDGCDAKTGCTFLPSAATCSDGDACTTGDLCNAGACLPGAATGCDDGNSCTTDACNPATGCSHANATGPCNDGNACTVGDACVDAACLPGAVTACDDGNACSADACDPTKGCGHVAIADATPCGTGELCGGGVCLPLQVTAVMVVPGATALAVDATGNSLWVAHGCKVSRYDLAGKLQLDLGSDVTCAVIDGTGSEAKFKSPDALVTMPDGSVFVHDAGATTVRRIQSQGGVTVMTHANVVAPVTQMASPGDGLLYLAGTDCAIRSVSAAGKVTLVLQSVCGSGAELFGLAVELLGGKPLAYLSNALGVIHDVDLSAQAPSPVLLAGTPVPGFLDGPAAKASFGGKARLALAKAGLLVADAGNHRLRLVTLAAPNTVWTLAGNGAGFSQGGAAGKVGIGTPTWAQSAADGSVYVLDGTSATVLRVY